MKNTRQYWVIGFVFVIIVFSWGLTTWLDAYFYEPIPPIPAPVRPYTLNAPEKSFPMSRYQKLMDGSLFWGIYPAVTPPDLFRSSLTLWGTIKGSTAIVSLDPSSNLTTRLVKVGDEFAGEKIIEIGRDYILVRNSTGEGKVKM